MSENDLFINQIGRLGAWLAEHVPHSPSAMWLRRMIDPISLWWSGKTLSMVNGASCRNYVIWRTAQPRKWHHKSASPRVNVSVQTACHELQTLGSAIKWYHAEHGPLAAVPKVTLPEQRGQKSDYWLTRKEVADRIRVARRNHFAKHIARVLLIGVYTGTRPGDVFALKWMPSTSSGYFDLEAASCIAGGTRARRAPNKRQPPAKIHARLLPHLRRWKVADEKIGCTDVINFRGRAVCKVHQAWRAVAEDAGATQRDAPHIIRHTAATWQMQAGTDLYEAAGYLGMSPLTLWNVYGHNHPDFQSRAANAVPRRAKQEHAQETPGNPGHQRERTGNPDIHFP